MLSVNNIKFIKSLQLKKNRIESGLFVIEGEKMIIEAIQYIPGYIERIYYTHDPNNQFCHFPNEVISDKEMSRISGLKSPSKCLALIQSSFQVNVPNDNIGTLVLDDIQDPGNLGTIIRTADWFGIKEIICSEGTADMFNPKVVQATMGSIFHIDISYKNLCKYLNETKRSIYGAVLDGKNLKDIELDPDAVIVIGNESKGISPEIKKIITHPITIEKIGLAESLNAGIATGIILSKWRIR